MSLFDLTGKVAIITGSSRGIGRAIAEAMADQGAKVVISSRKAEACQEVADAINAKHRRRRHRRPRLHLLEGSAADPRRRDPPPARPDRHPRLQRRLQPLLRPDGRDQRRPVPQDPREQRHRQSLADPDGRPRDDRAPAGSIIIVSSIGGLKASAVIGAYNVSKAADFQLARNLAAEFGPHQVRVNCIAPGLIRTDFARALWENPDTLKMVTAHTPLQRIGEPHEIAGAAVFLASRRLHLRHRPGDRGRRRKHDRRRACRPSFPAKAGNQTAGAASVRRLPTVHGSRLSRE